jgi:hypothetical protein
MLPSFGRTSTGPQVALRVTATGELSIADISITRLDISNI